MIFGADSPLEYGFSAYSGIAFKFVST